MKSTAELKFLLTLLGCADYRSRLNVSPFKSFKEKNKICQDLYDRGLVEVSREIAAVKMLPPGRALLKVDPAELPITEKDLKVLERIAKSSSKLAPSEIKSVKAAEREEALKKLSDRGLIEAEYRIRTKQPEVWLTPRGIEYLRDDYHPSGRAQIDLALFDNYLNFLRKSLRSTTGESAVAKESPATSVSNLSDEDVLETIEQLDRNLGTENYLPIFHLRQKLQPPFSREDLDQVFYRLQRSDRIELSSLQEASAYTPEQIDAGIPQNVGGPLFFIVVI